MKGFVLFEKTLPSLPRDTEKIRELSDVFWIEVINLCLLYFAAQTTSKDIDDTLSKNDYKNSEKHIKQFIYHWFKNNRKFRHYGLKINREAANENDLKEGFYDLKFEHSYWGNEIEQEKYFPFECKCIYGSDSNAPRVEVQESDLKEYVFDGKDDGGVYRYITGKYATNQNFGGVLGFLLNGNCEAAINKIKEKLENLVIDNKKIAMLEFIPNAIENQPFTFNTKHNRIGENKENILLHHFIFDFTTIL
jgi:hypothetical protein